MRRQPERSLNRHKNLPASAGLEDPRRLSNWPLNTERAAKLASRTLTNLYNEGPAWLDLAHRRMEEGVFAAYG